MTFNFSDTTKERINNLSILMILVSIAAGMLFVSWRKWPDLLVDFGWELYAPWQMNNYGLLPGNIYPFDGSLSCFINTVIFKIFGASLMSIAIFNIILTAVLTIIIFRFYFLTTDKVTAAAASSVFLSMFAFSQYMINGNYNFVCPYTHKMSHGIIIAFIALYCFSIYLIKKHDYLLWITALLAGFEFLAKMEVFVALFAALLLSMLLMVLTDRLKFKTIWRMSLIFISGFLIPIIGFLIYLSWSMSFDYAILSIMGDYKNLIGSKIASNMFYRRIMGLDSMTVNLYTMFKAYFYYLVVFTGMVLVGFSFRRIKDKRLKSIFTIAVFILVSMLVSLFFNQIPMWYNMFKGLPLAMLTLDIFLVVYIIRGNGLEENRSRLFSLFAMTTFGLLLLFKMILNVRICHYGFALALPATLLFCAVFSYYTPAFFEKFSEEKFIVRSVGLLLIGITILFHVTVSKIFYDAKNFPVGSGSDTFMTFSPKSSAQGPCVQSTLAEIERIIKKDETFVTFPQGIMLNYLAKRKYAYPYINLLPFGFIVGREDIMLETLKQASPDYILLVDTDSSGEFGYQYFGKDYGVKIFTWVKNNYSPVSLIGEMPFSGSGFGILITKRKEKSIEKDMSREGHSKSLSFLKFEKKYVYN